MEPKGLRKLGGISLMISGALFLMKAILDLIAGPPPSNGVEILVWVAAKKVPLAWTSEVLFFAIMFLVPAVIALYQSLADTEGAKAAFGCGVIAAVIPITAVLLIVHGRLVYPVYGLRIAAPAVAELVVALFYGGLHATALMFGIATIVLSFTMKRGIYGRAIAVLGMATGVFDLIGSYPWLIGPGLALLSQTVFAAWFLAVGARLVAMSSSVAPPVRLRAQGGALS